MSRWDNIKSSGEQSPVTEKQEGSLALNSATKPQSAESLLEGAVEKAVNHAIFGSELARREFLRLVGAGTASAIASSIFPLSAAKALAQEKTGPIEKKELKIGFIPITCATPIIMADPLGFYRDHGLEAEVINSSDARRPRLGCRAGTFSPSRRQIRSTLLSLTSQPARR